MIGHLGDGYDAARAFRIYDLLPESRAGYWVAIPSREELAVWPVTFNAVEDSCVQAVRGENYREHAYPVTDEVSGSGEAHGTRSALRSTIRTSPASLPDEFIEALKELEGEGNGESIP